MKKTTTLVLAALLMLSLMTGCGNSNTANDTSSNGTTEGALPENGTVQDGSNNATTGNDSMGSDVADAGTDLVGDATDDAMTPNNDGVLGDDTASLPEGTVEGTTNQSTTAAAK